MKTVWLLVSFLAASTLANSMLSSISLGKGSSIRELEESIDSKLILNGDVLYRINEWGHTGLEIDLNIWEWSGTDNAALLSNISKLTVGRAGFLGSFRGEIPKESVKLVGQVGAGVISNNVNLSGGGVNGSPKQPPMEWSFGYNVQAGLSYKYAIIKVSNKNIFLSGVDQNWFGISIGVTWEYF